ncbi:MAG: Ppx/GppA family phosphatase [Deltaproteobacteria bacterium]|nr:MAG: Ppx/GppA family phosphatase [Deltaproteobacteria bacterium]
MNEPSRTAVLADDPESPIRFGVVDIGSNSVRFVVFDGPCRAPDVFFNEKVMCGLGADLRRTGRLSAVGSERALSAVERFAALAGQLGVEDVEVVATAAVREAVDGAAFVEDVHARTGWRPRVVTGEEEARLAALGVLFGIPGARGWVVDMGGASIEVARVEDGHVFDRRSLPIGPLSLGELPRKAAERTAYLRGLVDGTLRRGHGAYDTAYIVGGSARAIARVDMVRRDYPLPVLHHYVLGRDEFERTRELVSGCGAAELRARTGISAARIALLPNAVDLMSVLLDTLAVERCVVSSFGLREGTLFDRLGDEARRAEPLVIATREIARRQARFPAAVRGLLDFVEGLVADLDEERRHWVTAACHLYDVNWREHPDVRHEVAFDSAMRANFGGIGHEGRVFIALALYHRYKKRPGRRHHELAAALLDQDTRRRARVLGRAMRLWASFGGAADPAPRLVLEGDPPRIELVLPEDDPRWTGEVVRARLRSVGDAAGLDVALRVDARGGGSPST